jgi:glycosyltransferase involved in cell wall biosynthesis
LLGSFAARATPTSQVFSVFTGLGFLFGDESIVVRALAPSIRFLFHQSLKNNSLIFFHNPDDLKLFVTHRIVSPDRTCRVYGSGVNTKRFVPHPPKIKHRETVFLMIARLISAKGVLDYIESAEILRREGCCAHFRLLGAFDDHPTAVPRGTIQSAVDTGIIEYCGTTTDVRPYLHDADVFVLPSYYNEGTPRATLEALSTAKPIITTDSPGCRETVIHDSNGYLVPVRDPVALADAMRKLVGDHDQIRIMGARSRKIAEELYDVDNVNSHLWREVTRAITPKQNGRRRKT